MLSLEDTIRLRIQQAMQEGGAVEIEIIGAAMRHEFPQFNSSVLDDKIRLIAFEAGAQLKCGEGESARHDENA